MEEKLEYSSGMNIPKPTQKFTIERSLVTLYLGAGTKIELSTDPNYLYIQQPENNSCAALNSLKAIVTIEPVAIEPQALSKIINYQIPIVIFSQTGSFMGKIAGASSIKEKIDIAQANMNQEMKLKIMQPSVWGNLRRCRRYLMRSRGESNSAVDIACEQMEQLINRVYQQETITALIETFQQGQQLYYSAFGHLLKHEWGLKCHEPNSVVSRMLDFSYKLLEESVKIAVENVGLNPTIGFWHTNQYQQQALIADLANEFKLYSDRVVVKVLNKQAIVKEDFDKHGDKPGLPLSVVHLLLYSYMQKMNERVTYPGAKIKCSYEQLLCLQAKQIAMVLCGEISDYYSPDLR
ncbi:CRISPR-associated endonuclease Cas1 [Nostoc sp. FACHB-280]|uniref:CRISPR-associated endonuclease Cas1 n=1 Tax=Nostoc sp. FACHB-280 TaxID=2692839 RepID=UPI00168B8CCD|nr:CRISPR-associated endonuclease Cas1 [Nostoc sp. FACHB-280]MBD2498208.1 CRISPR-associated endonuclease Cas1 [Nostoc sp. FACHB-280]